MSEQRSFGVFRPGFWSVSLLVLCSLAGTGGEPSPGRGEKSAVSVTGACQAEWKFPPELVQFKLLQKEPIFTGGGQGAWDEKIRERGWIIKEGTEWKLWYTGYDGTKEGQRKLGYATSPDGLKWTRHPRNPLLPEHWIEDMMVVQHAGNYYLFAEGKADRAHLFVSPDGLTWRRLGQLDIRLKNGQPLSAGPFGTPTAWFEKGLWHLFYERNDQGVWLATSRDLKVWTNVQDEPVLRLGPGDHDRDQIALNQIIKHGDRYHAYYHGCARTGANAGKWSVAVATSTDLIHWEKYPGNPLTPVAENKSSGILIHDGERYRMYTMHPEVWVYQAVKGGK